MGSFPYGNNIHTRLETFLFYSSFIVYFFTSEAVSRFARVCRREINIGNFPSFLPHGTSANLTLARSSKRWGGYSLREQIITKLTEIWK